MILQIVNLNRGILKKYASVFLSNSPINDSFPCNQFKPLPYSFSDFC